MDYYSVLQVPRTATSQDIKKAYKRLALKEHPDKNLKNQAAASEQFMKIAKAYAVLGDEGKRLAYDQSFKPAALRGSHTVASTILRSSPIRLYTGRASAQTKWRTTLHASNPDSIKDERIVFESTNDDNSSAQRIMIVSSNINGKKLTTKRISVPGSQIVLNYENGVLCSKYINGVRQNLNQSENL